MIEATDNRQSRTRLAASRIATGVGDWLDPLHRECHRPDSVCQAEDPYLPTFIHVHEQTWPGYGLHTTRLIDPAIDIGDLPPLDLVELSHFHSDHFDLVAERDPGKSMPITTTPEAAKELTEREFNNSCPIDAWTSATVANGDIRLRVTALPGRHGPPLSQVVMPEVMGSMLEFLAPGRPPLIRIYITGDTLVIDEMHGIARRYPNIDLGLLHLGGTEALGIMVTMDGEHGTQALKIVNPKRAIPIQFNDNDAFKSLLSDFQRAVTDAGL